MKNVHVSDPSKLYSVEKRKEIARKYHQDEQFVINMTKEEYTGFVVGIVEGEKEGAKKMLVGLVDQPSMVVDILNEMTVENRNAVFELCKTVEEEIGNDEK